MTGATGEDTSASPTRRGGGARAMSVFDLFPLVLPGGMIWRYSLTRVPVMLAPVRYK